MNRAARFAVRSKLITVPAGLLVWLWIFHVSAAAQGTQGQNAVYPASAKMQFRLPLCGIIGLYRRQHLWRLRLEFLRVLNFILNPTNHVMPVVGAVIDARGLPGNTGTSMTCAASPWAGITQSHLPRRFCCLRARSSFQRYGFSQRTHVIGQGDNVSSGTTIQAAASNFSGSTMIAFCSVACAGVAVEKLVLDGKGLSIDGIVNAYAGSLSYVDHVSLYQILGTGLVLTGVPTGSAATGSGPYTNINFNTGSFAGASGTVCMQIRGGTGLTGTAGIRGLNCTSSGEPYPSAAVLLDASNNSIKDVTIVGFQDGILVGAIASAQNNVLINVIGDTRSCPPPSCKAISVNVIHIKNTNTVSDLVIVGANDELVEGTNTIEDDETSTTLGLLDPQVAVYALGKPANNGYARFTTSPSVPTWASGITYPTGTCTQGSLYSCTASSSAACQNPPQSAAALWGCPVPGGNWAPIK